MPGRYFVYIATNRSGTLYIGMTNELERRMAEHQSGIGSKFTKKYRIGKLVFFEETDYVHVALTREKELKGWRRDRKIALIETMNPNWRDIEHDE